MGLRLFFQVKLKNKPGGVCGIKLLRSGGIARVFVRTLKRKQSEFECYVYCALVRLVLLYRFHAEVAL